MLAFGWAGKITLERATRDESQLVQPEISTGKGIIKFTPINVEGRKVP